ncbi:MAG TPA: hypothetical protein H9909_09755 [Candidatus Mediterraneibacter norfolkensis]|nr:hypothetical protein [Candidatus Mediterraneibacter norfolkensis]
MEKKIGGGEWQRLKVLNEEIEIALDIPEGLRFEHAMYWILRNHEGTCDLLEDLDDRTETLTIRTDRFSTYAILYTTTEYEQETAETCFMHWLILAVNAAGAAVLFISCRRTKRAVWIIPGITAALSVLLAVLGCCVLDWLLVAAGCAVMGIEIVVFRKTDRIKEEHNS